MTEPEKLGDTASFKQWLEQTLATLKEGETMECTCHHEHLDSHELCCGHDEGRDPDCPIHGDGSGPKHN